LNLCPKQQGALIAQYLCVRQRKLGTIIIQTVRNLHHESAVTDSLPEGEFVCGHSNLCLLLKKMAKPGSSTVKPLYSKKLKVYVENKKFTILTWYVLKNYIPTGFNGRLI
jgi:hypothetical protein